MKITVYANRAEEVAKRLSRIGAKATKYGVPFTYTQGEEHPQEVAIKALDPVEHVWYTKAVYTVASVDFEIHCDELIKQNGWTVCAQIEHGEHGNIVTGFNHYDIPTAWYKAPPKCDHCNTNRFRSVTYMVKHDSGEIRQVGKTCLHDYTGISPEATALWASVTDLEDTGYAEKEEWETTLHGQRMFQTRHILACAIDEIEKDGYRKADDRNSTKEAVITAVTHDHTPSEKGLSRADEIIKWALARAELDDTGAQHGLDRVDNIERDCFPLVKSGYAKTKHIGRLAYLPMYYTKYLEKKALEEQRNTDKAKSQYIGNVGDRIRITVANAETVTSWETMWGTTWLEKIKDESGNVYIWKTSACTDIKPGKTLTGTVKDHSEFNGEKQTVLTRCKVA